MISRNFNAHCYRSMIFYMLFSANEIGLILGILHHLDAFNRSSFNEPEYPSFEYWEFRLVYVAPFILVGDSKGFAKWINIVFVFEGFTGFVICFDPILFYIFKTLINCGFEQIKLLLNSFLCICQAFG